VPRQLLDNGQKVIEEAAKRGIDSVGLEFVEGVLGGVPPETVKTPDYEVLRGGVDVEQDFIQDLSPTQQDIVKLLLEHESLSIAELSDILGKDIRSVGSLIRKLRGLNKMEVARKPGVPYPIVVRRGKEVRMGHLQYVYSLSDNVRRLLAKR
jgi:DNA-binding transcriptional ArsR family regulator